MILRFKLDAAKAGLEGGERSIADVALGCGFTSPQYMHLVFKRELGCTPRAYRDRARNDEVSTLHQEKGEQTKF
jgi:LacI family transcriptional regulator